MTSQLRKVEKLLKSYVIGIDWRSKELFKKWLNNQFGFKNLRKNKRRLFFRYLAHKVNSKCVIRNFSKD